VASRLSQGLLLASFLLICGNRAVAQFTQTQHPAAGQFLVATDKLDDPNFAETVVLIIQYDEDEGTVGVIVNRRSQVPLSKVFSKKGVTDDPVFAGGPVDLRAVQALLRSPTKPTDAIHIIEDVYATGNKEQIEKSLGSRTGPSKFRVYLGYAGWESGQLEAEIQMGAWSILRATPTTIFDENPDSLWDRLNRQANSQIASVGKREHCFF
jgi:putative transcriptional regulator